jgi:hypothetical protein
MERTGSAGAGIAGKEGRGSVRTGAAGSGEEWQASHG